MTDPRNGGLSLAPFRALRPNANGAELARRLCPPYDVITPGQRAGLLAGDPDNAVAVILPQPAGSEQSYHEAAQLLRRQVEAGRYLVDGPPALYIYEMQSAADSLTRGLVGAVELRDPADGVILPHENTMAGPVADRLALMTATEADLEPIYLVYDGGGAASQVVADAGSAQPLAEATTADGVTHRLWSVDDPEVHRQVEADLHGRRALIADGHHRYATYRELQRRYDADRGPGPWDRGLALLVDSTAYGPQVHAIHRVITSLALDEAVRRATDAGLRAHPIESLDAALAGIEATGGFAVVVADGGRQIVLIDADGSVAARARREGEPPQVADLDVTVVHRVLVEQIWGLSDTVEAVGYAHDVAEALGAAAGSGGTAVLLRPTPVAAVAAVAAAGARMPRKSTLFTPKPASGLLIRRFADET